MSKVNPDLIANLSKSKTIYFVCSGNIIRSSFAHLYAQHLYLPIQIKSLGTKYKNHEIHEESAFELKKLGIDGSQIKNFKPTHISEINSFPNHTIFFAMTHKHVLELETAGIDRSRIYLLTELLGRDDDIADPYFHGNYHEAFQIIRSAVDQLSILIQ